MMMYLAWPHYLFAGITGACLGSFCSVLVYRLPAGRSVVSGRSRCFNCKKTLAWYELIPVLSFLLQKAHCRTCSAPISWRYLYREVLMAGLMVTLLSTFGWSVDLARFTILAALLMVISEIDLRHGIVPNKLVLAGGSIGVFLMLVTRPNEVVLSLLAAAGSFLFLLLVREGSKLVFGRAGLGMGDVKLLAMLALFIGWYSIWAFYLATLIGGLAGLIGIASGHFRRQSRIPFAPFITLGVACSAFVFPLDVLSWFW